MTKIVVETEGKDPVTFLCDACVIYAYREGAASNLFADGDTLEIIEEALDRAEYAIGDFTGSHLSASPPN